MIKDKQDIGTSNAHDCLNKEKVQPTPEQKGVSSQSNTLALIERVKSQNRIELEQQNTTKKDELEFVRHYRWEIEQLKSDGYWSNKAGDFLPLVL